MLQTDSALEDQAPLQTPASSSPSFQGHCSPTAGSKKERLLLTDAVCAGVWEKTKQAWASVIGFSCGNYGAVISLVRRKCRSHTY